MTSRCDVYGWLAPRCGRRHRHRWCHRATAKSVNSKYIDYRSRCEVRMIRTSLPRVHYVWRHDVHSSLLFNLCWCSIECYRSHIPFFLWWLLKHRGYMPCLGVNSHLKLKNALTHSQKTRSSQIYGLQSGGDQMVSTPIQLEGTASILVILKICSLYFSYPLKYGFFNLVLFV